MVLEQIHIPFAPELASSVDISNQIVQSSFVSWITENWQWFVAGLAFILFLVWVSGGFDKSQPIAKEEPEPRPTTTPTPASPFQTPKT